MTIRKANLDDIELLIELRLDFLADENGPMPPEEEKELKQKLTAYFTKWLTNGGFTAFLAEENGQAVSTAFLWIAERPPRDAFSSNLVGTVYNVYTYAGFRRKGIAAKVMSALLEEARVKGAACVNLLATEDGKPLYEKLGFEVEKYTAMRKKPI